MDWCIEPTVPGALDGAERAVLDHLARHAELQELVELAGPIVHQALAQADGPGARWISVEWEDAVARLTIRRLAPGDWPGPGPSGPGLELKQPGVALAHEAIPELARRAVPGGTTVELGVVRSPEWSLDPVPAPHGEGAEGGEGGEGG